MHHKRIPWCGFHVLALWHMEGTKKLMESDSSEVSSTGSRSRDKKPQPTAAKTNCDLAAIKCGNQAVRAAITLRHVIARQTINRFSSKQILKVSRNKRNHAKMRGKSEGALGQCRSVDSLVVTSTYLSNDSMEKEQLPLPLASADNYIGYWF